MVNILIAVNPSFYNKGDASILRGTEKAFAESISQQEYRIVLLSQNADYDKKWAKTIGILNFYNPKDTRIMKAIRNCVIRRPLLVACDILFRQITKNLFRGFICRNVWSELKMCDVVLVGLNGTFTPLYGIGGFCLNIYWTLIGKWLGKKVVVFGASTEPTNNVFLQRVTRFVMNKVDLITLRESFSQSYLNRLGVKTKMFVTSDLAFLLDKEEIENNLKEKIEKFRTDKGLIIGMTVSQSASSWLFPSSKDPVGDFAREYARILDWLIQKYNAGILFIPHSVTPTDDRIISRRVYEHSKYKSNILDIQEDLDPGCLKSIIEFSDIFIGARTHSVISALTLKIPSIVLAASHFRPKGIIGQVLGSDKWVYEGEFDNEKLLGLIEELISDRDEYFDETFDEKLKYVESMALLNASLTLKEIR